MRIPSFREWMDEDPQRRESVWLVLGKGPSFAHLGNLNTRGLLRFGLNHVVRETCVDVFHTIDIEVVEHCGNSIEENASIALLPWAPHIRRRLLPFSGYQEFLPAGRSLEEYLDHFPVLLRLAEQGRLYWYNLHTAPRRLLRPEAPITPARGFSASTAIALLAGCGVQHIRTLGIDGGRRYAENFEDLTEKTLLAGGQDSFNSQFAAIARLIQTHGLDLGFLDHPVPARVRIETRPGEDLPARVLAHSLRRHASLSLDIWQVPRPSADAEPLSFPHGKTLSLEAATLIQSDLRSLWTLPKKELEKMTPGTLCSHLLPFSKPVSGDERHPVFPSAWYVHFTRHQQKTSVICWTDESIKPWLRLGALGETAWCETLIDGVRCGTIETARVVRAVAAGEARASLLIQISRGIADPALLRRRERVGDIPAGTLIYAYSPVRRLAACLALWAERLGWLKWYRYILLALDKVVKLVRMLHTPR